MTTSERSKTTITFWLKKMVILLKSWRGNIVVKLFTTTTKSWLVNLLRNMLSIFQDIPEELLRKSWELFPGISTNFVHIFFGFSAELVTWNSLVTRNSLDRVMRISSDLVTRISRNSCRHFHRIFPWKIPGNFRGFPGKIPGNFRGFSAKWFLG